jgi:mitotic spindle assembly checkpoint protein MAD2B
LGGSYLLSVSAAMADQSLERGMSFNETVAAITEFVECAIHYILYVRQIYPPELFVRRKKYEAPVYQSRHPGLNEYISGAIRAVGHELVQGQVDKIVVLIKDKNEVALERFIFAVQNMIEVDAEARDVSIQNAMTLDALPHYFRSFLIKLSMMESQLAPIPSELSPTFTIVLEFKDGKAPVVPEEDGPVPWVPASRAHTTEGVSDAAELHMVRAVETGVINVSLLVQESEEKLERERIAKKEKGKGKGKEKES